MAAISVRQLLWHAQALKIGGLTGAWQANCSEGRARPGHASVLFLRAPSK